jgi:hypothetical protein
MIDFFHENKSCGAVLLALFLCEYNPADRSISNNDRLRNYDVRVRVCVCLPRKVDIVGNEGNFQMQENNICTVRDQADTF